MPKCRARFNWSHHFLQALTFLRCRFTEIPELGHLIMKNFLIGLMKDLTFCQMLCALEKEMLQPKTGKSTKQDSMRTGLHNGG
nr:hypothetical protein CFP56_07855 [Quercus suber]